MRNRILCQCGLMFVLGILFVRYHSISSVAVGLALAGYVLLTSSGKRRRQSMVLLLLFFLTGALRMQMAEREAIPGNVSLDGRDVSIQGRIYRKEIKKEQPIYYINQVILTYEQEEIPLQSVILYPDSDTYSIGTYIYARGIYTSLAQARNEGNYDEQKYYRSEKIQCKIKKAVITDSGNISIPGSVQEYLYQLRERITRVYEQQLPGEESGLMATMALGNKSILDEEAKKLYQMAGLSHILAISGLHISVFGMGIYTFLRKRGASFAASAIASGGIILLYGCMSGMSTSTMRAMGMFMVMLLANVWGEAYDSLTAVALLGLLLLMRNPEYIESSGFLFSFGAVLGVVVVAIPLQRAGAQHKNIPGKIVDQLVLGLGLFLSTLPMVAYFYYEVPIYVTLLNLILLPLLSLLLFAGMLGGLLGVLPWGGVFGLTSSGLLKICHVILYLYEAVAAASLHLPCARVITGQPKIWVIALYYGILLVYVQLVRGGKIRKRAVLVIPAFLLLLIFAPKPSKFEMDMLDVGQGDGTYIATKQGVHFFIDGGSSDVSNVGTYRILPFLKYRGVRKIDYWLISHADQDHISGLLDALENDYPIGGIICSKVIVPQEGYLRILQLAKTRGIPIHYLSKQDEVGTDSMRLICLYPGEEQQFEDANAASMVLLLQQEDFTCLLTGDTGEAQEEEMVSRDVLAPYTDHVNVLKAAHHGSASSNSKVFLEYTRPQMVTVSCGAHNSYGHPAKEAVKRIEEEDAVIYYTMNQGQIRILCDKKSQPVVDVFLDTVIE